MIVKIQESGWLQLPSGKRHRLFARSIVKTSPGVCVSLVH